MMKDITSDTFPDFVIAHAVCFPAIDVRPADLDQTIDHTLIIDRSDMRDLNAALLRIRDYWRSKRVLKRASRTSRLLTSAITAIRQHLARDIELRACRHDGKFYMFYAGAYNNWPQQIGCAVSLDGLQWKRVSNQPVLPNATCLPIFDRVRQALTPPH